MPKARETNLPQINANQGLYGELALELMPSAAEDGQIMVWMHASQEWKFAHLTESGNIAISINSGTGDIGIAVILSHTAVVAPTVTDDSDSDFKVGSVWIDTVTGTGYLCVDATVGAAVWKQTTA